MDEHHVTKDLWRFKLFGGAGEIVQWITHLSCRSLILIGSLATHISLALSRMTPELSECDTKKSKYFTNVVYLNREQC